MHIADIVLVAVIVGFFGFVGPWWLQRGANAQRNRERAEDKADRDAVSKQAEKVATLLADSTTQTIGKLDEIHTLVNSNLTGAIQDNLDSTTRELVGLNEIIDLKRKQGIQPTVAALATVKATEEKIGELTSQLEDRRKATAIAAAQKKAHGA